MVHQSRNFQYVAKIVNVEFPHTKKYLPHTMNDEYLSNGGI